MALTPPPAAPQRGDRATFAQRVDAFITWLIGFVAEFNTAVAALNSWLAGGAYAIPCVAWGDFSTTAAGNGRLSIVGADQTLAANIYVNTIDSRGKNVQSMLSDIFSSTSNTKAYITIFAQGDPSRWISYRVTAWSYGGFATAGKLDVVCVGFSGANPISVGASLVMQITRTGDKGDTGQVGKFPILWLRDEKPSNTPGSSNHVAGVNTRDLNAVMRNEFGASLSSNRFTVPAGTYRFKCSVPASGVGLHKAHIFNHTANNVTVYGTSENHPGGTSRSLIVGDVTFVAPQTLEIRHYVSTTSGSLGQPAGGAGNETYTEVIFEKVA